MPFTLVCLTLILPVHHHLLLQTLPITTAQTHIQIYITAAQVTTATMVMDTTGMAPAAVDIMDMVEDLTEDMVGKISDTNLTIAWVIEDFLPR